MSFWIGRAEFSDFQVFRITDDIGESKDLSSSMPEKLAELTQRLKTHYRALLNGSHIWDGKKP